MFALHFGAGNIGRGFIGYLLVRSGYQVTFVDVKPDLVRLIQERGRYSVHVLGPEPRVEWVEGVTALDGTDADRVADAVARADLVTTAVGASVLPKLAPVIAEGLRRRGGRPLPARPGRILPRGAFLPDWAPPRAPRWYRFAR